MRRLQIALAQSRVHLDITLPLIERILEGRAKTTYRVTFAEITYAKDTAVLILARPRNHIGAQSTACRPAS